MHTMLEHLHYICSVRPVVYCIAFMRSDQMLTAIMGSNQMCILWVWFEGF